MADDKDSDLTARIDVAELRAMLAESWVDSPDDDVEIHVDGDLAASADDSFSPTLRMRTMASLPSVLLAVDFGSCSIRAMLIRGGQMDLLTLSKDGALLPSVIGLTAGGAAVFGDEAKALIRRTPSAVVWSPRRFLGRQRVPRVTDANLRKTATSVVEALEREAHKQLPSPIEVCGELLNVVRLNAEKHAGTAINHVVMTVPALFSAGKRDALAEAARLAGLHVLHFIPEAAAVAAAYAADQSACVGVFDIGGQSADFSVVGVRPNQFDVLSAASAENSGGSIIDEAIARGAAEAFLRSHEVKLEGDAQWPLLLDAAENAKQKLATCQETSFELPIALPNKHYMVSLKHTVRRSDIEAPVAQIVKRALETCDRALTERKLSASALDVICLSGSASQTPGIAEGIGNHFARALTKTSPPDLAVIRGAGAYTAALAAG